MFSVEDANTGPLGTNTYSKERLLGDRINAVLDPSPPPPSTFESTNNDAKRDRITPNINNTHGNTNRRHICTNTGFHRPMSTMSPLPTTGFKRQINDNTGFETPIHDKTGFDRPIANKTGFDRPISNNANTGFNRPIANDTGLIVSDSVPVPRCSFG